MADSAPPSEPRSTSAKPPPIDVSATISQAQNSLDTSQAGRCSNGLPAAEAAEAVLPRAFGRYELEKQLGKGAMGVVYLASDSQLQRKVALKIPQQSVLVDSEALERFYREASTAGQLRHPNICPVYDVGEFEGTHYLTMAYIEGKSVDSFLKKLPPPRQVALLIRKLASALEEAHQHGVVHRDLKPSSAHPRAFQEKYKEHQPEKYADDVAKVLASGKTPAGTHRPIMVAEILQHLAPRPGAVAVDCTLGYGGHARQLLGAVQPGGRLIAIDVDPIELPKTEARLRHLGFPSESLLVRRMNYAGVLSLILSESPDGADVMLADLGPSSMQIDNPERGFTFKAEGPLDMRMNPDHSQPASVLLSKLDESELATLLEMNADEPQSARLARAILDAHSALPLRSTTDLANVVAEVIQRQERGSEDLIKETIRRVFQAIRIAVNDEFGALDAFLRQLPACLKPGGRCAIISFHSGEDRRVKRAFKAGLCDGIYSSISEEVIRPSVEEQRVNPRSSSAKLRVAVKAP